jgi:hypothetical protein
MADKGELSRLREATPDAYRATRDTLDELVGLVTAGDVEGFRTTLTAARRVVSNEP